MNKIIGFETGIESFEITRQGISPIGDVHISLEPIQIEMEYDKISDVKLLEIVVQVLRARIYALQTLNKK